jgi:hypothetical protein
MALREWVQRRMAGYDGGRTIPAYLSALHAIFTDRDEDDTPPAEPHTAGYSAELEGLLRRRDQVTRALLALELTTARGRVEAIPRLRELLREYPHPLVYEALINAYVDSARWDEARGLAYAARERRRECERSPYLEVRLETDRLREWSVEEVDELRREHEAGTRPPLSGAH